MKSHTGPAADFTVLDAAHKQIVEHLDRLGALMQHIDTQGIDAAARGECGAIESFFSSTSRTHHLEEEARVFPVLLNSPDEELVAKVRMLQQDHGWIEEDWLVVSQQLRAVADGTVGYVPEELHHAVEVFLELCREHIQLEESLIYPEAKAAAERLPRRRAQRGARPAAPSSS
jgi:hemerythrin-like domain-containing protein